MEIIRKLFIEWDLGTWANVLEVVGFTASIIGLVISLFIKSELSKLRTRVLFDQRITNHLNNLKDTTSNLNNYLNDYNNNMQKISMELSTCQPELEDIIFKLGYWQASKIRRLKNFIKKRRKGRFVSTQVSGNSANRNLLNCDVQTTYNDIWRVYTGLLECIRHLENIKKNNSKKRF